MRRLATVACRGLITALATFVLSAADCRAEKLAITFDDLPLNGDLAKGMTRSDLVRGVLAILHEQKLDPVYGFVNSKRVEDSADGAEALRLWIGGGEHVGNHTYSHFDLSEVPAEQFLQDVRQNEPVLELLDPSGGWRWFRYPYLREGDTLAKREVVRRELRARGYRIAQVTIDWEDYLWNSPYARCVDKGDQASLAWLHDTYMTLASQYVDADRQMAAAVFGHPIDHILLLHLGAYSSVILPDLLALLRQKGFTFTPLEQLKDDEVLGSDPKAGSRYGGTLLEQWLDARGQKYPPTPAKPYKRMEALCR